MNIKEKDLVQFQLYGDNMVGIVTEVYENSVGVQYLQETGTYIYSGRVEIGRHNVNIYYPEIIHTRFAQLVKLADNFDLQHLTRDILVKFRMEIIWLLQEELFSEEVKTIKHRLDNAILTKDFPTVVYLVDYDNGELYSDNDHWVERAFSREQDAFEFVESNKSPNGYNHYTYFAMGVE